MIVIKISLSIIDESVFKKKEFCKLYGWNFIQN